MWKVTLKGLLAHRVRLVLTTLSVVLGVAFVSGTYVLTDTMSQVFDDLVRGGTDRTDVVLRSAGEADSDIGSDQSYYGATTMAAGVLDAVLAVDGVASAEGSVEGYALIVRPDGEPITPTGPPTLGAGWSDADRSVDAGGRAPRAADEVVIDATTARRNDLRVGDRVTIVFAGTEPRAFTLVGTTSTEGGEDLAGATLAQFDLATAQEVLGLEGAYTAIYATAEEGVTPDTLVDRLDQALPGEVEAITAADFADEIMTQIGEALGFLTTALGIFAAIALVVGAFIIANTFSITVLQRSREFALLRALGASRGQVIGSVVAEAVVVGTVAAAIGVVAGLGLAAGLYALLSLFGLDMPSGALVLLPRTIVVGVAVGVGVTVLSSLLPARRAAAVHPVAALRDVGTTAYEPPRARVVGGVLAAVVAVALTLYGGLARPERAGTVIAFGAVAALAALAATGPSLTRPLLWLLGGSGRHLGPTARLARGNSLRTPRRTWTTAAALTMGLALVSAVAVMAASMKASVSHALDETLRADLVVTAGDTFTGGGVPTRLAQQLEDVPEVGAVSPLRVGPGIVAGERSGVTAIDPTSWARVAHLEVTSGALADVAPAGAVAVDRELATEHGYAVGDVIDARFPATGPVQLRVRAVYEPDQLLTGWVVSTTTHTDVTTQALDASVLVAAADGVDVGALRTAVTAVADAYPSAVIQDQAEYRDSVAGSIDRVLALVTALLGMALLIAVLGIMNTLALSVHERTREIGLLRAVGMTRTQVRRMVRWEAITVALLGVTVGVVLGTGLGWAATRVLAEDGMTAFVLPAAQLAAAVVLAILAGVVAAVLPARRAAGLDVLRAVTVD